MGFFSYLCDDKISLTKITKTMRYSLNEFREQIKNQICQVLTDIYLSQNDGLLPNWENDEEIIVKEDNVIEVDVIVYNTYDEYKVLETFTIDRYIVTLDNYLYFDIGDETLDWTDVSTENLVDIWERVNNIYLDL